MNEFKRTKNLTHRIGVIATAAGTALLCGCAHHHPTTMRSGATTQIAATPARQSTASQRGTGAQMSSAVNSAGTETGHVAGEAARDTGHVAAVAGRETGHVVMQGARGTEDLFTKSAVGLHNSPPESLSAPNIDVDEAMQARDWRLSVAHYPNGSTVAGPTEFAFVPAPNRPQAEAVVVEPSLFFVNLFVAPIEMFEMPPWTSVQWKAASVEPTYTAVPPLPPEDKP